MPGNPHQHAQEYSLLGLQANLGGGMPDVSERLMRSARAALDGVVARHQGRGVEVDAILREGISWSEIVGLAASLDADLIVMGTHGRRGLARAFLGSVAEKVVRYATVPVLTVHTTEPAPVAQRVPHGLRSASDRQQ